MEAKKCINCGNNKVIFKIGDCYEGKHTCHCTKCEYSSASCKTKNESLKDWNEHN